MSLSYYETVKSYQIYKKTEIFDNEIYSFKKITSNGILLSLIQFKLCNGLRTVTSLISPIHSNV